MTPDPTGVGTPATTATWRWLPNLPALDGIRGLAVLLVVLTHVKLLVPYEVTGIDRIDDLIDGSYLGVDLFFVLSGFLITTLLLDEAGTSGTVRFGAFYTRRALRLLPALYVLLAAHGLYAWIVDLSWLQEWATIRSAVLYVSNWQLVFRPLTAVPDLGLLWSLAIEEQFYLLWPAVLLVFFGPRQPVRAVAGGLVALILAVALWRAHLWHEGVFWAQLAVRTDTRVDALLIGALLASLWVRGVLPTRGVNQAAWVGLVTILACLATFDITTGVGYKGGLTLFSLAAAAVILGLIEGTWEGRRFFDLAPLRAVGRVSYGLYLWHYPVFYAVSVQGETWTNRERVAVALTITAAATVGSWYLVERPALSLKSRLGVARPASPPRVAPATLVTPTRPRPAWGAPSGTATWLLGAIVGVLAVVALARFTVLVGDPETVVGAPAANELAFPEGDVDRSGYWALADLEPTLEDSFDRDDAPTDLGTADTGQPWEVVTGTWGILTDAATVSEGTTEQTLLAIAPQEVNDGLVEVTLRVAAQGAGLAFRYRDPENYWSVTADPTSNTWTVAQVVDGVATTAAEFSAPAFDGVTISVTQSETTIRFLIDGVEYFRLLDPVSATVLRSGLAASGPLSGGARWDRYLVMIGEDVLDGDR